jgi:hypothetical protein
LDGAVHRVREPQTGGLTWTGTGAKALLYAQDNAGSTTVLCLEHDQYDRIGIGPNKAILVGGTNAATTIAFFGEALQSKQTITGPIGSVPASTSIATALATYGLVTNSQVAAYAPLTYSASISIDASQGTEFVITATNNTNFAINAPTNPTTGQRITVRIKNTSGGALGTVTWNAVFKMAAWTSPATANNRAIDFSYDGTNWLEAVRTAADVPN